MDAGFRNIFDGDAGLPGRSGPKKAADLLPPADIDILLLDPGRGRDALLTAAHTSGRKVPRGGIAAEIARRLLLSANVSCGSRCSVFSLCSCPSSSLRRRARPTLCGRSASGPRRTTTRITLESRQPIRHNFSW